MEDKKIELTVNVLNAVLAYLGTKPYQETFQLIQAIQQQAAPQISAVAPPVISTAPPPQTSSPPMSR